jgi:glycosyltransferase involved in cell wall biosynthesis
MKYVIVHISSDYPDTLIPNKTRAVFNLVEGTPEYRHVVYSLNRVSAFSGLTSTTFGKDRIAVAYGALPKGILWGKRLREVGQWIGKDLKKRGITPDLIEAHKYTIEGLIGLDLAREFSCPLVCDIQGNTDTLILKNKVGLRSRYREIAKKVSLVFSYSPWALAPFKKIIGLHMGKCQSLPVIPSIDKISPAPFVKDKLLTIFHLNGWKSKNIFRVIKAIKKLSLCRKNLSLDIYGRGSPKTLLTLHKLIKKNNMIDRVNLCGEVENENMPDLMKNYAAFVLPSQRETYGLVYAESLLSGIPVLYSRDRGIDGYFDKNSIGYACDPSSVDDIANGINFILERQLELKNKIAVLQENGSLDFIRKSSILDVYRSNLNMVLSA